MNGTKLTDKESAAVAHIAASGERGYRDSRHMDAPVHSNTLNGLLRKRVIKMREIDGVAYYYVAAEVV